MRNLLVSFLIGASILVGEARGIATETSLEAKTAVAVQAGEGKKEEKKEYNLNDYVNAVIEIESHGNPNAKRYEPHLKDTSYGLGQLLTQTALELEGRHPELPRLGITKDEVKSNLCNPDINRKYTAALFEEELDFYGNADLAVAAYNAGHLTPRNARIQEMLNDLYCAGLVTDGVLGKKTKEVVEEFQAKHDLKVDGVVGKQTYGKLQEVYKKRFPERENPKGIVPVNNYTPNHINKFRNALH